MDEEIKEELIKPVSEEELDGLKNVITWTIYGYKHFYFKEDEESQKLCNATAKILSYFADHMLMKNERERFSLIQSLETADDDIKNMEYLFRRCESLNDKDLVPKAVYDSIMQFYLATDEDLEYTEEYSRFAKTVLAAGAIEMSKDDIERITGKIELDPSKIDKEEIDKTKLDRVIAIMNDDKISYEKKDRALKSLDYIDDYLIMLKNDYNNSLYSMNDDIDNEPVIKNKI